METKYELIPQRKHEIIQTKSRMIIILFTRTVFKADFIYTTSNEAGVGTHTVTG
jgi:hypothetical protein